MAIRVALPDRPPLVQELAAKVGETIHLAQLDDGQVSLLTSNVQTHMFKRLRRLVRLRPLIAQGAKVMLANIAPKRLQIALRKQSYFQYTTHSHASAQSLT